MTSPDDTSEPPAERSGSWRDGTVRRPGVKTRRSRRFQLREAAKAGLLGHWLQGKPRDREDVPDAPKAAKPDKDGPAEL